MSSQLNIHNGKKCAASITYIQYTSSIQGMTASALLQEKVQVEGTLTLTLTLAQALTAQSAGAGGCPAVRTPARSSAAALAAPACCCSKSPAPRPAPGQAACRHHAGILCRSSRNIICDVSELLQQECHTLTSWKARKLELFRDQDVRTLRFLAASLSKPSDARRCSP